MQHLTKLLACEWFSFDLRPYLSSAEWAVEEPVTNHRSVFWHGHDSWRSLHPFDDSCHAGRLRWQRHWPRPPERADWQMRMMGGCRYPLSRSAVASKNLNLWRFRSTCPPENVRTHFNEVSFKQSLMMWRAWFTAILFDISKYKAVLDIASLFSVSGESPSVAKNCIVFFRRSQICTRKLLTFYSKFTLKSHIISKYNYLWRRRLIGRTPFLNDISSSPSSTSWPWDSLWSRPAANDGYTFLLLHHRELLVAPVACAGISVPCTESRLRWISAINIKLDHICWAV